MSDAQTNRERVAFWQAKVAEVIKGVILDEKISREAWTCLSAIKELCVWANDAGDQVPPKVAAAIKVLRLWILRDAKR